MPPPRITTVQGRRLQLVIDVLVRLVGVHDARVVLGAGAVLLQIGQEAQARVADGDVHETAAERDALGLRGTRRRGEDREVAGARRAGAPCAPDPCAASTGS